MADTIVTLPYTMGNLPPAVKDLPPEKQKEWLGAWMGAYKDGKDEESCFAIAWDAVGGKKNSEEIPIPEDIKDKPEDERNVWLFTYEKLMSEGNSPGTCEKYAYGALAEYRQRHKRTKSEMFLLQESGASYPIKYEHHQYEDGEIVDLQFCCVGENITDKQLDRFVENFKTLAYGQPIGLHVNHPFFTDDPTADKRRYGDILDIYKKGTLEGWTKVRLNPLGAQSLNNREYLSLSPGYWTKYKHFKTKKDVQDVLFEISMTNIPQEKMMEAIIQMAENRINQEPPAEAPIERTLDIVLSDIEKSVDEAIPLIPKYKRGSPMARAKLKDALTTLRGMIPVKQMSEEIEDKLTESPDEGLLSLTNKEELNMADQEVKKLTELETENKKLQQEKVKAENARTLAEEMVKKHEEQIAKIMKERRHDELVKLTEKYLPHMSPDGENVEMRFNTENQAKAVALMETMTDEQVKTLDEIITTIPPVKLSGREKGVSGLMKAEEPIAKKLSDDRKVEMATAKASEEKDEKKRFAIYQAELRRLDEEGK